MAAIVYLDVDDEITSAAARIRALEDERIALVLPLGSRLATSRINFRLLAREAEARGKRIEVITNDASARALAASAGLPTHVSVAAFEAPPAPPGPRATASLKWRWRGIPGNLESILWPVVRAAANLLTSPDAGRLRMCAGPDCGWLYVDRSRNGLRRWCEMETCGTLEKSRRRAARRHRERPRVRARPKR